MASEKTPGSDGLPCEFYKVFWNDLAEILLNALNFSFETGQLSISQRRGIVKLIPKKDAELFLIKNWRPLTLLNCDYKIASKAIASRIKTFFFITSLKALHSATKQFGQLYDAFGVHCEEKNVLAASPLPFVDNAVTFYHKCVSDIGLFFKLSHGKCLDGSLGAPSIETIDSLEMISQVLRVTIAELSVSHAEVKLVSKALRTMVNEHLFSKALMSLMVKTIIC